MQRSVFRNKERSTSRGRSACIQELEALGAGDSVVTVGGIIPAKDYRFSSRPA
jgi:methylmalonyl-CoA mutase cobalamin-binding subunit